MNQDGFQKFKLVFLGEQSVGKTSVVTRLMYDEFSENYKATVGIDFLSQTLHIDGHTIRLQIWDTAGQERFKSLTPAYIRDSAVAVIVYDITNLKSFETVPTWAAKVRAERGDDALLFIVGNKTDLEHNRKISTKAAEEKSKELGAMFGESSAKTGHNIKKIFHKVAAKLLEEKIPTEPASISVPLPSITKTGESSNSGYSCFC